ncbi:MAG: hypothetical protein JJ863_21305 [Deltaproteobacteria bacterium]|nr:hypothetical protein [Deltaproteobacteria bacterium]
MSERTRSKTPTYGELAGEDTRPGTEEARVRQRRRSSQQIRAVVCVRCTDYRIELERARQQLEAVRAERQEDAAKLQAAEDSRQRAEHDLRVMTIRAENAERELRARRGVER